ncbi:TerB family tellurite resistance protein [Chryseolinea sp. T2]|uniref:tellurite resistance TerB family protein n=1 Tax=Chryseolinea sp. T2 TaxID=3129255 RepID=UPI0030783837
MVIHKTLQDFIVFLYVHISQADNSYDPNEMALIKAKMKKLYPAATDIEQKLYTTIREYNTYDRAKLNDLFKQSIEHFGKEGALESTVHADLNDIILADGKVKADETRSLDRLRSIIDQHAVA